MTLASFWSNEKTWLRGFQQCMTQTGLLSYSDEIEAWNFRFSKYRYYTIQVANNKGADQTARMRRLVCAFVVHIWHKQIFSWRGSYYGHDRLLWLILKLSLVFCINLRTSLKVVIFQLRILSVFFSSKLDFALPIWQFGWKGVDLKTAKANSFLTLW